MTRPRTPTNVLDMRGAFAKNPKRGKARENEPIPTEGVGPAPGHFNEPQASAWRTIVEGSHPGVLSKADAIIVEMASVLLAQFRLDANDFPPPKYQRLQSLLASCGMSPSDRSKVGATNAKPKENPFAALRK